MDDQQVTQKAVSRVTHTGLVLKANFDLMSKIQATRCEI